MNFHTLTNQNTPFLTLQGNVRLSSFFVPQKRGAAPLQNPSSFSLWHAWGCRYGGPKFWPKKSKVPMGISLRGRSFLKIIDEVVFSRGGQEALASPQGKIQPRSIIFRNIKLEGNSRGISRGGELGRRFPSKLLFSLRSRFKVINSPFLPRGESTSDS